MEFTKDENEKIWIKDDCKYCNDKTYLDIKEGKGPHIAELKCNQCGRHNQWMSKGSYEVYQCYLSDSPEQAIMLKIGDAILEVKKANEEGDWIEGRVARKKLETLEKAFEKMQGYNHYVN